MNKQARSLRPGMFLASDAGPVEVTEVSVSRGGVFAAAGQVVITFVARGVELQMAFTPGQRVEVVSGA